MLHILSALSHHVFRRAPAGPETDLSFRSRGREVSRLEGFSDAVFGFAITILVIANGMPTTIDTLLAMGHSVLPFIASFSVLFWLWRAQFDFFRRYGLEDSRTVRLTGVLLMIVLIAVYPVKFLCTFIFDVLPVALIRGDDSMKAMMSLGGLPKVLLLYAIGGGGIGLVFSRLYRHAATQHEVIGLREMELFDTRLIARRWRGMATVSLSGIVWCIAMIVIGSRVSHDDPLWTRGIQFGWVIMVATNLRQRLALRRLERSRPGLAAAPRAPT